MAGQSKTYVHWSTSSTCLVLTFNNVTICLCQGKKVHRWIFWLLVAHWENTAPIQMCDASSTMNYHLESGTGSMGTEMIPRGMKDSICRIGFRARPGHNCPHPGRTNLQATLGQNVTQEWTWCFEGLGEKEGVVVVDKNILVNYVPEDVTDQGLKDWC